MATKKSGTNTSGKVISIQDRIASKKKIAEEGLSAIGKLEIVSASNEILFTFDVAGAGFSDDDDKHYIADVVEPSGKVRRHLFVLGNAVAHLTPKE